MIHFIPLSANACKPGQPDPAVRPVGCQPDGPRRSMTADVAKPSRQPCRLRFLAGLLLCLWTVWPGAGLAQSLAADAYPLFRADDAPADHLADNPALLGLMDDDWAVGASVGLVGQTWEQVMQQGFQDSLEFSLYNYTKVLNYRLHSSAAGVLDHQFGLSLGFDSTLALGYRYNLDQNGLTLNNVLGFIWRPVDFLSLGFTWEHILEPSMATGFGLALRPLFFVEGGAPYLSLSADARVDQSGFVMETLGASVSAGGFDLKAWYDFQTAALGAQFLLRLGASELAVRHNNFSTGTGTTLSVAARGALPRTPSLVPPVGRILVIGDIPVLASSPQVQDWLGWFLGEPEVPDLVQAEAALRRAASDPSISGVLIRDMPGFESLAAALRFAQALEGVKRAGKPVQVYLTSPDTTAYAASLGASHIGLNPLGGLLLQAFGSQIPFLREFFDQFGIRFVNLGSHETKSANNMYALDAMPDSERQMRLRYLQAQEAVFAKVLERNRTGALKLPAAEALARGPWLTGKPALDTGLVDALQFPDEFQDLVDKTYPDQVPVDLPAYVAEVQTRAGWGPSLVSQKVAVVYLNGTIAATDEEPGASIGNRALDTLANLVDNPQIGAVILRVNSGGGTMVHSANLDRQVQRLRQAGKKVVVSMADVAASGGYYLAVHADRIFAEEATLTGSIGVTGLMVDLSKTLGLLKVHLETVQTADNADFASPLGYSPADEELMKAMIADNYQAFLQVVSEGRKIPLETLEPLARGQVWTGTEAVANGLVDALGGLDAARDWLRQEYGQGWVEFLDVLPGAVEVEDSGQLLTGGEVASRAVAGLLAGDQLGLPGPAGLKGHEGSDDRSAVLAALDRVWQDWASRTGLLAGTGRPNLQALADRLVDRLEVLMGLAGQVLVLAPDLAP